MARTKPSADVRPSRDASTKSAAPEGAMTRAMRAVAPSPTGQKVLRVAIVTEGAIHDERVLAAGRDVTIGTSPRCDFVLPGASAPSHHILFERGDTYTLHLTPEMSAHLQLAHGRETRGPADTDAPRAIPLDPDARGKLTHAATTILFQLVDPPPRALKPTLPSAARGGIPIDWRFTSFVIGSYLSLFVGVIALENSDWKHRTDQLVPDRLARLVFHEPPPPPETLDAPTVQSRDPISAEARFVRKSPP